MDHKKGTLNLAYPEKGTIKFEHSQFPDGQQQIKIFAPYVQGRKIKRVEIITRLTSFLDLELICAATASLKEMDIRNISIKISYFLGARSDRVFSIGSNNYLKSVIAPIINSLGFRKVSVFDPHSYVLEGCINNFRGFNGSLFLHSILAELFPDTINGKINNVTLVCPDSGYLSKMYTLLGNSDYKGEIVICTKHRTRDGITDVRVDLRGKLTKPLLIMDDICDGGRTFIEIVDVIREKYPDFDQPIYLGVSHGIFSNGFTELEKRFDRIFCTNSFRTIDFEAEWHYKKWGKKITQFDYFNLYKPSQG